MTLKNVEILCIVRGGTRKFANRIGWTRSIVLEDKAKHLERDRSFSFSDRKDKRDEGSFKNGTIDDHRGRDGTKMDRAAWFVVNVFALHVPLPYLVSSSCESQHEIA